MNILIMVKDMEYSNGGVCTQILSLCRCYKEYGHEVILIADGSDYDDEIKELGIKYIDSIRIKGLKKHPWTYFGAYSKLYEICETYKIDIIHLHTQSGILLAEMLKRKKRIPYLWTNHIDDIPHPWILRSLYKRNKFKIISVSEALKKDMICRFGVDSDDDYVIPNGIDLKKFKAVSEVENIEYCKKYNINPLAIKICELSRIAKTKGQDVLIKAVKNVQDIYPDKNIEVILAGPIIDDEWYRTDVVDYAKKNNIKLKNIGVQKPRDFFSAFDLFVLPSRKEGFGMVCIESLAMKCPVIRTNSPGWQELQDYCEVIDIDSVEQLTDKIIEFIERKEILYAKTELGYKAVYSEFNEDIMAKRTLDIYNIVIEKMKCNREEAL